MFKIVCGQKDFLVTSARLRLEAVAATNLFTIPTLFAPPHAQPRQVRTSEPTIYSVLTHSRKSSLVFMLQLLHTDFGLRLPEETTVQAGKQVRTAPSFCPLYRSQSRFKLTSPHSVNE